RRAGRVAAEARCADLSGGRMPAVQGGRGGRFPGVAVYTMKVIAIRGNEAEIEVGGRTHFVPFVVLGTRVQFAYDGEIYTVDAPERSGRGRTRHRDHSLEAPMPGLVLKVLVAPGATVEKGQQLVILEAMK